MRTECCVCSLGVLWFCTVISFLLNLQDIRMKKVRKKGKKENLPGLDTQIKPIILNAKKTTDVMFVLP